MNKIREIAEALKHTPGQWRLVGESKTVQAAKVRSRSINAGGHEAWSPAGSFESGHVDTYVYARYLGGEEWMDKVRAARERWLAKKNLEDG